MFTQAWSLQTSLGGRGALPGSAPWLQLKTRRDISLENAHAFVWPRFRYGRFDLMATQSNKYEYIYHNRSNKVVFEGVPRHRLKKMHAAQAPCVLIFHSCPNFCLFFSRI